MIAAQLIVLVAILAGATFTYFAWSNWEGFVDFWLGPERNDDPVFERWRELQKSALNKWSVRILGPVVVIWFIVFELLIVIRLAK